MYSILIVGGDMRQIILSKLLRRRGYEVYIKGFVKLGIEDAVIEKPDCVFLPIPYKFPDGFIKAPYAEKKMKLSEIVEQYPNSEYVLGGYDSEAEEAFGGNIKYTDLLQNEAFLVRNALLTAQGTIAVLLREADTALSDSTCVIIGYGRISKFLCRMLRACGAEVIATARRERDLELIRAERMRAVHTKNIKYVLPEADIILNTVPSHVLGEEELKSIRQGARLVELASPPFGVDMELARKTGVAVQLEQGLPGRLFPASAAEAVLCAFEGEEQ